MNQDTLNLSQQTVPSAGARPARYIIAIDPGASGGLAVYRPGGTTDAVKMPETPKDVCDWITAVQVEAQTQLSELRCYLEEVGGYTGEGQPGSAMFNFGRGFGNLEGFLIALGIPFVMVRPQKWQASLSLGLAGKQKGEYTPHMSEVERITEKRRITNINARIKHAWKAKLKEHAQRLHPQLHVTLSTADALLILEYGKRQP